MTENVCHFVPYHKDYQSIHTINFVLETKELPYNGLITQAVYRMCCVRSGKGFLHTMGKILPLKKGDVFFTFPAYPFCIESVEDFSYMYISFLGTRANMIMEKLKISKYNHTFEGCNEIIDLWQNGLDVRQELSDVMSESILLYTFAHIGNKLFEVAEKSKSGSNTALSIKKYIDDNFSCASFSIDAISKELSYNKKYISTVFKKSMGIGISEYLNTIRIQQACELIKQGFTCISDIAGCCGYSDPQYFSKVFRQKMSISPGEYIRTVNH